jgi:5'-3' exonuclease
MEGKNLTICSEGDPDKDLFIKIVIGDKSDNIPPVFSKIGL